VSDITITGTGFKVNAFRNGPLVPSDGYGGHQVTERPKKRGITDWVGRPPFKVTVPILLSHRGASVENDLRALEGAAIAGDNERPDPVELTGVSLLLPPGSGREGWFIDDIDRSGREDRSSAKTLIRKELVLTLLEKVKGDTVKEPALTTKVAGKTVVTHYTVKHGDTLQSIAARQLGEASRWTDIAVLNGLRSNGQLKVGMVLKLP
jgi:nucleoid-associated protein YgaU